MKTVRFQFDPARQVINLRFCRDTIKVLNKNFIFVPTKKTINKNE